MNRRSFAKSIAALATVLLGTRAKAAQNKPPVVCLVCGADWNTFRVHEYSHYGVCKNGHFCEGYTGKRRERAKINAEFYKGTWWGAPCRDTGFVFSDFDSMFERSEPGPISGNPCEIA